MGCAAQALSVSDLSVAFHTPRGTVQAVSAVSLHINEGETLGLVGESGCGKSSLGRAILRLIPTTSGTITLDGEDITHAAGTTLRHARQKMQMVFQDPSGSLNPRSSIGRSLGQPLRLAGWSRAATADRIKTLLSWVGLPQSSAARLPHELSGGQRQRIGIARALALSPKLIICDEPVSALDVSVRAQIINLLADLKNELSIATLFISHDLSVVEHVADRVMVMYLGAVMEVGAHAKNLWTAPAHPYTQALLSAAPVADPVAARRRSRIILEGELPSPIDRPSGCPFEQRCRHAAPICRSERPALRPLGDGGLAACHFAPVQPATCSSNR